MNHFVLDCSITMTWCFEDECNNYADQLLSYLGEPSVQAIVPSLWKLETVNVLRVAEKRQRLSEAESLHFLDLLESLPITIVTQPYNAKDLLMITRSYNLSAYDAAYLLLALQESIPLATLDQALKEAAQKAKVALWTM
ncbi:MAG: type II toxin-antitoxin system VapC family toxin [Alphaproteobacteria bacterium]|nr:type II toxin-antitoxin system VapC family toxin [Alphaproteobacteria bacterium]